ncbi:MAG: DUF4391 domain-containing protein [Candidatus Nanoarchaeia archaeon]|nr:DUF4391 domain-containing protein [Candidatus Nanoarchaeia archaeon]
MFDLPKNCFVNKFIPKKVFYEKVGVATNIKDEFVDLVEKIVWLYKISPDTLGVNKTANVEEIQVFEINLKEKKIPKNVIKTITKNIPYPILFVIKYEEDFCYSIKVEENYFTNWNENVDISFKGINLEYIYEQIVKVIIKQEDNSKKLEEVITENNRKNELSRRIQQLTNKIRLEKQFNKKAELNRELRILQNEMEILISEK